MSLYMLLPRLNLLSSCRHLKFTISRSNSSSPSDEGKVQETSLVKVSEREDKVLSETQSETLPRRFKVQSKAILRFDLEDEDPHLTKHRVFQQITQTQSTEPIYSLEDALLPGRLASTRISYKYPKLGEAPTDMEYYSPACNNEDSLIFRFPEVTDFVIVGSGLIGSAVAYYLKKRINRTAEVVVIDKNPYSTHNCTAICSGLLSSQSKSRDTSRMASITKELLRNLRRDVLVTDEDFAKINYRPCTHLILWPSDEVDEVTDAIEGQNQDFAYTEARTPSELEARYPFLRVRESDVVIGTLGNQDEALIDPIQLRNLYRTLAQAHGARFVLGEVIDFNCHSRIDVPIVSPYSAQRVVARVPATGELVTVNFSNVLLSMGHNTPFLEHKVDLETHMRDTIGDMHFLRPKLRICYTFRSDQAPVINFPVITDTDGSTLIKQDFAGSFKYYLTYEDSETLLDQDYDRFIDSGAEEPYVNLIHRDEMFEKHFEEFVKPKIVKRIPCMEDAKFQLAYSGFENYNTFDGNPVIGKHPYHEAIHLSGGFGSRLMSLGPAAAITIADCLSYTGHATFDATNFLWNRVYGRRRMEEFKSIVGE